MKGHRITRGMEVIGADGVHIGTIDRVTANRITVVKADSGEGSHKSHSHYIDLGLVADIEGCKVRLSANALTFEAFEITASALSRCWH